jgi:putative molybdopterin biosynthesis protein
VLTRKVHSPLGDDEYLRVSVGEVRGRMVAAPLARGAGVLTSLVRADGIVRIPRMTQGLQAGEVVRVMLYRPQAEIRRSIVHIGSHDLTLDLLSQYLGEHGVRLISANAGSVGGLVALRRGETHLAGCHLLDPATGEYNLRYIGEYLPGLEVVLVGFVGRAQGLMVARGNPKGITSLTDLGHGEVRFVNRQRGAGTRVLLDYHLEKLGIEAARVRGYEREVVTHLAVAVDVASGVADCGLGIAAAAQALGLDFVPVAEERYDLVIPAEEWEGARLAPLRAVLGDVRFREAVAALPGYDVSRMGELVTRVG